MKLEQFVQPYKAGVGNTQLSVAMNQIRDIRVLLARDCKECLQGWMKTEWEGENKSEKH